MIFIEAKTKFCKTVFMEKRTLLTWAGWCSPALQVGSRCGPVEGGCPGATPAPRSSDW